MLALLLSWICIGWLSLVFGLMGMRAVSAVVKEPQKPETTQYDPDYTILLGFILITVLLSGISIFVPINYITTTAFLITGIGLTVKYRSDIVRIYKIAQQSWASFDAPLKIAFIVLFLLSSLAAVYMEIGESDTWFYHSQSIIWIKEYAVVPGLGNLFGRLAFNSHFFIVSALFSTFPSEGRVLFPILSFFFFIFNARLLINIHQGLQTKNWFRFTLNGCLFLFFAHQGFDAINGTDTDIITCILLLYVFLIFLESAFQPNNIHKIFLLWVALFTAATFKHSALLTGVLLLFILPQILEKRKMLLFGASVVAIMLPFLVRNVILSGYLIYPFPEIDIFNVDWKIPLEEVIFEKELIEGWAKLPRGMEPGMKFEDVPKILAVPFPKWFSMWWPNQSLRWELIMLIDLFSVVLFFYSVYKKNYKIAIICFVLLTDLLFWFIEAPEPRFGFSYLFFDAALVLAFVLSPVIKFIKPANSVFYLLALFLIALPALRKVERTALNFSTLLYPVYEAEIKTEVYQAGNFMVRIPSKAFPANGYWCFCSRLPCTPFPKKNLFMRGNDYQEGFKCGTEAIIQTSK